MKRGIVFASVIATSLLAPRATLGQVSVNKVILTMQAGQRPVKNITVSNSSDAPVGVTVQVERAIDLTESPIRYEVADDLFISPKNFSIGPNGQRTVRLLLKAPPTDRERAYRVLFVPRPSEFDHEPEEQITTKGGHTLSLQVATGVGLIVYAEPADPAKDLQIERDVKGVVFTNRGTIQAQISSGVSCPGNYQVSEEELNFATDPIRNEELTKKGCARFEGRKIHAGAHYRIDSPPHTRLYLSKRFGSEGDFERLAVEPIQSQK